MSLSDQSTPAQIYAACDTYAELSNHRGLVTVNKLISCIATYNHKHKCSRIEEAFLAHRQLTLARSPDQLEQVRQQNTQLQQQNKDLRQQLEEIQQRNEQLQRAAQLASRDRDDLQRQLDELRDEDNHIASANMFHSRPPTTANASVQTQPCSKCGSQRSLVTLTCRCHPSMCERCFSTLLTQHKSTHGLRVKYICPVCKAPAARL
jgi:DNA repair exonuclease SbcCD ATPase subunit